MSVIGVSGIHDYGWFAVLLVVLVVVAILTKSFLANLALIFACVLGVNFGMRLADVGNDIRYAVVVMMFCLIGFAIIQLLTRVEGL